MTTTPRKKLIEVALPLEEINKASAREKSIRHGHPSTLHLWWARRPLAACRAVIFAQLVDDPSAWPDRFPSPEAQAEERKRLHQLIGRMVPWEASNNESILNEARYEIARSVAWGRGEEPPTKPADVLAYLQQHAPPVYDPFCGGGSIPLEAQRLGLRAYGSDLNPVAVLISKALVEIPPKFAGQKPINPEARKKKELVGRQWKGAQGLAEDVRYYGRWMREQAEKRIGHLYPKAKLADGSEATVIAWLWARTVRSPDPAAKGAQVPLISTYVLSRTDASAVWITPNVNWDTGSIQFSVEQGAVSEQDLKRLASGSKTGRGEFACLLTGAPIGEDYIRDACSRGNGGFVPMAAVVAVPRGKAYVAPAQAPIPEVSVATYDPPLQAMFSGALGFRVPAYGVKTWGDFFRPRQIASLSTFSDLVPEAQKLIVEDGGSTEYAAAIAAYLACGVGRAADYWTINTMWEPGGEFVVHTFSEMTIPIVWDSAEANPFTDGGGGWDKTCMDWVARVIEKLPATSNGLISNKPAQELSPDVPCVFSTDPPYYDNIGYADLSDCFYIWHRRALASALPELTRTLETPKIPELTATPARRGGTVPAREFFLEGMRAVFTRALSHSASIPMTIYYSFKEKGRVGSGSGWESFLQGVIDSGWQIDGSWPLKTERPTRNRSIGKSALASSIVLVCRRKNGQSAATIERDEFKRALRRELPDALAKIRAAGVGPVDMAQAAIGPGMGVFTRYSAVLEASGEAMKVKDALKLINEVRDEIEDEGEYDLETRFAVEWFAEAQWEAKESGRAILLANAKNLAEAQLERAGIIDAHAGKTRLRRRDEIGPAYNPEDDKTPTVWEHAQALAYALETGGQDAAAVLFARLSNTEAIRALAYRLYGLCERKGWSAEALVWNRLAEEWRRIEDLAASAPPREAAREGDLFGGAA